MTIGSGFLFFFVRKIFTEAHLYIPQSIRPILELSDQNEVYIWRKLPWWINSRRSTDAVRNIYCNSCMLSAFVGPDARGCDDVTDGWLGWSAAPGVTRLFYLYRYCRYYLAHVQFCRASISVRYWCRRWSDEFGRTTAVAVMLSRHQHEAKYDWCQCSAVTDTHDTHVRLSRCRQPVAWLVLLCVCVAQVDCFEI